MHKINCPYCGMRNETEFSYQGDATKIRPQGFKESLPIDLEDKINDFCEYVYIRDNPAGWHLEWWHHAYGCRQVLKVLRNTITHEIKQVAYAWQEINIPNENINE